MLKPRQRLEKKVQKILDLMTELQTQQPLQLTREEADKVYYAIENRLRAMKNALMQPSNYFKLENDNAQSDRKV